MITNILNGTAFVISESGEVASHVLLCCVISHLSRLSSVAHVLFPRRLCLIRRAVPIVASHCRQLLSLTITQPRTCLRTAAAKVHLTRIARPRLQQSVAIGNSDHANLGRAA